jgi:hypothetical protein
MFKRFQIILLRNVYDQYNIIHWLWKSSAFCDYEMQVIKISAHDVRVYACAYIIVKTFASLL